VSAEYEPRLAGRELAAALPIFEKREVERARALLGRVAT